MQPKDNPYYYYVGLVWRLRAERQRERFVPYHSAQSGPGAHLLSPGSKDTSLCVKAAGAAKLTSDFHLVPRLGMLEL
jgi:hypothetical protein